MPNAPSETRAALKNFRMDMRIAIQDLACGG